MHYRAFKGLLTPAEVDASTPTQVCALLEYDAVDDRVVPERYAAPVDRAPRAPGETGPRVRRVV